MTKTINGEANGINSVRTLTRNTGPSPLRYESDWKNLLWLDRDFP